MAQGPVTAVPPLAGRAGEMAILRAEARRAAAGEARIVLLVGEPGSGTTRLAADALGRWRGPTARARATGGSAPLGVWCEAIGSPAGPDPAAASLMLETAGAVAALTRDGAAALLLDDVHHADLASWEVLALLARRHGEAPVLVLATAHRGALVARADAAAVAAKLELDGVLRRLEVPPLPRDDVATLAAARLGEEPPAALREWLWELSGGRPLLVLALLDALVSEGGDLAAPVLARAPEAVAARLAASVRELPAPARSVLETLAVLDRRVGPAEVAALSGAGAEATARALEALAARGLAAESDDGTDAAVETAHPLVGRMVREAMGPSRRRLVHTRLARELARAGRPGEAATHAARSAAPGDPLAVALLLDALRAAELRDSPAEVLAVLDALVSMLSLGDPRWLDVLDAMPREADWILDHRLDGEAQAGARAMRMIAAVLPPGDPSRAARVQLRLCALLAWGAGDLQEAELAGRRAVDALHWGGEEDRARLAAAEISWVRGLSGDLAGQEVAAREVLSAARAAGDRRAAGHALGSLAASALHRGRFDEARSALARAMDLAGEGGRGYRRAWARTQVALLDALEGRAEDALVALAAARAEESAHAETLGDEIEAYVRLLAGDLARALTAAQSCAARRPRGLGRRRAWVLAVAAIAAAEAGDARRARADQQSALAEYAGNDFHLNLHICRWASGVVVWLAGDAAGAAKDLQRTGAALLEIGAGPLAAFVAADWAEAAADAGDAAAAQDAARCLDALSGAMAREPYRGLLALGDAAAALAGARATEAAQRAEEAAEGLQAAGMRLHAARALGLRGRALRASDDRQGAAAAFRRAVRDLDTCGASVRARAAGAALAALGPAGRRAAAATEGAAALTRREREVARLAARGLTAQEIGAKLFIGRRTVETHLANAYAKLRISGRVDLIRRAVDLGLEDLGE